MPTFEFQGQDGRKFEVEAANVGTANQMIASHLAQSAAPAEDYSTAGDVVKSLGIGGAKGAIGLAGLPGDVAELATKGINAVAGTSLKNRVPLPTSEGLQHAIEGYTGPFYKPKGVAGEYAQTLGEFVPGLALPGGAGASIARKAATQVVAPALASETAGQLTKGTEAEPYARIAGGLVGGVAGAKFADAKPPPAPTLQEIKDAAVAGYKSPDITDVRFKPKAAQSVSNQIQNELRGQRFNDTTADKTFSILEDLKRPVGPQASTAIGTVQNPPVKAAQALINPTHSYEDFQTTREQLSKLAGNFNDATEQAAATHAIKSLDKYIANVPQSHLLAGDATKMAETLTKARADYAVAKTGERVTEKLTAAEIKAASANSGANIGNATRQALRPLLINKKQARGLTPEESALVESSVRGSLAGNVARVAGNYLGGGGGLGALHTSAMGFLASGMNPLGLAAPLAGFTLKRLGDAITKGDARKIVDQIKTRSPTMQAYMATLPAPLRNSQIGARAALLSMLSDKTSPAQGILALPASAAQ